MHVQLLEFQWLLFKYSFIYFADWPCSLLAFGLHPGSFDLGGSFGPSHPSFTCPLHTSLSLLSISFLLPISFSPVLRPWPRKCEVLALLAEYQTCRQGEELQVDAHNVRYGQTPAHVAATHGHTPALQWLLARGAQVNLQVGKRGREKKTCKRGREREREVGKTTKKEKPN